MLRFVTYLSPSLPRALFLHVAREVARALDEEVTLRCETRASGPARGGPDPFSRDEADVGFLCAPSCRWLLESGCVEVLAAPLFDDARAAGRPLYFSDVIVRRDSPVRSFHELRGRAFAYNDPCSLSGYFSVLQKVSPDFFASFAESGSHLESIARVLDGRCDAAAIDSNVLLFTDARELRVIESLGPHPIQPVVARATLPPSQKRALAAALLEISSPAHRLLGFAAVGAAAYEAAA